MGLTVHHKLKFSGTEQDAKDKLIKVQEVSRALGFKEVSPLWTLDYSKDFNNEVENDKQAGKAMSGNYRWAKIQLQESGDWVEHKHIPNPDHDKYKGFVVMCWAGIGCEPTNIGLVSKDGIEWTGHGFTKTQYAEDFLKCHLQVITLLDACRKLDILKEVNDEGDYWLTRDLSKLGDNITESTKMIASLSGALKKLCPADQVESAIDKSKNIMTVKGGGRLGSIKRSPKSRI